MTQETAEKRHVKDSEVARIPWREFIRSQFRKIMGFIFLLVILALIINLSMLINPDGVDNPDDIITLKDNNHLYLMVLSSFLFIVVFIVFTKVVLLDHREEFGIEHLKQRRVIITFLLTTSFISLVYILLDISLVNVYLMTLPTLIAWHLQYLIPGLDTFISPAVNREAYATIRGYMFVTLLVFMFIFPLSMFLGIFTRVGRRTIKERREKKSKLPLYKLLFWLIINGILAAGSFFVFSTINDKVIAAVALFVFIGFVVVSAVIVLLIIITILRFGAFVTYSNFLLVFPFIFLFYLLPGGLWGVWDLIVILTSGGVANTIYENGVPSGVRIDPTTTDMSKLSTQNYLIFYLQTAWFNLMPAAALRIVELDFIIIVGLSALVIGFAEGYSILAIVNSIFKGVSIAKTGRVASRSAPKIMVITTRLFYLAAWLSFLWDNVIVISQSISVTFNISLPTVQLPRILNVVVDFSLNLPNIDNYLLVFTILAVPFYFILTSAFKFLSVSLALDRVHDDKQVYYLLISSAYILIVTTIFADIAALPHFLFGEAEHKYLPLAGAASANVLPFIAKIFEVLESVGFYAGVIFIFIEVIRKRLGGDKDKKEEVAELQFVESTEVPTTPPKLDVVVEESEELEETDNSENPDMDELQ